MEFQRTTHPDVILIYSRIFADKRGFFMESYQKQSFLDYGIPFDFVQDNHSHSSKGVLRGLHYQIDHPQGKLIRVVTGKIFDVAVDLRRSSANFGHWVGEQLSEENKLQMWIPPGFAHGFYVISDKADIIYKTTDYYHPQSERCIRWDDQDLKIDWPINNGIPPILSDKDARGDNISNAELYP